MRTGSDAEKTIATTMQGEDRRAVAKVMEDMLTRLRKLPGWDDGTSETAFPLPSGGSVEVTRQAGTFESFQVVVKPGGSSRS